VALRLWFAARSNPTSRLARGWDWQLDRYCRGWNFSCWCWGLIHGRNGYRLFLEEFVLSALQWIRWINIGSRKAYKYFWECYHSIILQSYWYSRMAPGVIFFGETVITRFFGREFYYSIFLENVITQFFLVLFFFSLSARSLDCFGVLSLNFSVHFFFTLEDLNSVFFIFLSFIVKTPQQVFFFI
jgi:hypothetical protein